MNEDPTLQCTDHTTDDSAHLLAPIGQQVLPDALLAGVGDLR